MNIKKILLITLLYLISFVNAYSQETDIFVQSLIDKTSKILSDNISKEQKITELKVVAKETVDIKGVSLYTLGSFVKTLDQSQQDKYNTLFENYFLKSFSSRLVDYKNPEIIITSKEVINESYTIVNSSLKGTSDRPEIKIDWRIYTKNPDKPLIRDLIIEGLSLARTQKEEFESVLNSNNGDINALFKILEEYSKN
ncbi:MAG: ABC transporter substrate-binding protein [Alphaproteobacteria bacterium]|nr:ABC transporter substrate-binding protein [Alphaproteobacteria bacterium]